nr:MAG TPA: hypothetical protein [Caudoviricetes sp.]
MPIVRSVYLFLVQHAEALCHRTTEVQPLQSLPVS